MKFKVGDIVAFKNSIVGAKFKVVTHNYAYMHGASPFSTDICIQGLSDNECNILSVDSNEICYYVDYQFDIDLKELLK